MKTPLLPLLTTILLITGNLTAILSDTDPGDALAMHALFDSLTGTDWPSKSDPCKWDLVTCTDGRVTAIQLGNKFVTGTLPPSLSNLTALTRLELQNNQLSGPLPPLGKLTALQSLLLHNNSFTKVPENFFSGLSGLQSVYLDNNPFDPWPIPTTLNECVSLVNFSAISANVTGGVPDLFGSLPSLIHLALSLNFLSGSIPNKFSGSSIRSLWLNGQKGQNMGGNIEIVSTMSDLEELWLQNNAFSGPLPDFTNLTNLHDLQLRDNQFTGIVPESLKSLKALQKLTLSNNFLQGPVPEFKNPIKELDIDVKLESFCLSKVGDCDPRVNALLSIVKNWDYPLKFAMNWKGNDPCSGWVGITCGNDGNITVVNFRMMGLNGSVPEEFTLLPEVHRILLSGNNLTGVVPKSLSGLTSLKELDLSDNNLSGEIPAFGKNVMVKTGGNPNIGKDIVNQDPNSHTLQNGTRSGSGDNGHKSKPISVGVIVGSIIAVVCGISILVFLGLLVYNKKRKHSSFGRVQSPNNTVVHPRRSGSDPDTLKITINGGTSSSNTHMIEAGNMVISIQVLRNVTNNFSEDNVLGRGGFGTVYKGELHDGTKIAVKRMESGVITSKGLNEFKSEIAVLTKVRHRNLVSLLGYCLDGNERLLVYEYMPQGTLSRHLFEWEKEGLSPLEWKQRLSIALDVARGVEYLHSLAHQSFIHRDLKPSNILLGDDMKAKVSDFGLVRLAPEGKGSIETRLAGTFGYLAPEYAVTGRVTTKADVYSFGVILMELITGRKALDETQPEESMHLVTWFRRMQLANKQEKTLKSIIDPTIKTNLEEEDQETLASISTVAELAGHCSAREPVQRPDMGHAVNVLASIAELWKPSNDHESEDVFGIDLDLTLPQALKKWQGMDGAATSSGLGFDVENTYTSTGTRPSGFADSFTSVDGR